MVPMLGMAKVARTAQEAATACKVAGQGSKTAKEAGALLEGLNTTEKVAAKLKGTDATIARGLAEGKLSAEQARAAYQAGGRTAAEAEAEITRLQKLGKELLVLNKRFPRARTAKSRKKLEIPRHSGK